MTDGSQYPGVAGRCYLVTGASSGVGAHTATLLAQLGAQVVLAGRDVARLNAVASQLEGQGHTIEVRNLDPSVDMLQWLTAITERTQRPLAGIAHCAGTHSYVPLRAFSAAALTTAYNGFTLTAAMLIQSFCRLKTRDSMPSVAVMSTISTEFVVSGNALYAASRAMLENLCRYFSIEYAAQSIRCNCVLAGHMRGTKMTDGFIKDLGEQLIEEIEKKYPLGFGTAHDAANALVFLLGTASRWITATSIAVDGGATAKGF